MVGSGTAKEKSRTEEGDRGVWRQGELCHQT